MGPRIRQQRLRRYGTKRAAYDAAKVNSGTWDKAESGGSVREDLLSRIVATLWPETDGDWTRVGEPVDIVRNEDYSVTWVDPEERFPDLPPDIDRLDQLEATAQALLDQVRLYRQAAGRSPGQRHRDSLAHLGEESQDDGPEGGT